MEGDRISPPTSNNKSLSLCTKNNSPTAATDMPRLEDSGEALLRVGHLAKDRFKRAWDEFCDFAMRDNVLEVAVGLMYCASSPLALTS